MEVVKHIYGSISIDKAKCPRCNRFAFLVDRELRCCGYRVPAAELVGYKRESESANRRPPSTKLRKLVLQAQENRCFWCRRPLETFIVSPRGRLIRLKTHWDHKIPFWWDGNSHPANFVASCNQCNLWKSGRIFQSVEEARVYLNQKLEKYKSRTA